MQSARFPIRLPIQNGCVVVLSRIFLPQWFFISVYLQYFNKMYLNILFTMISNELKLHFGKISLQNVTAFPLTQEDYAPEQINIFLKIKLIFFERLLHIRFLLYLFFHTRNKK